MSKTFAERYRWAASLIDPRPGEQLLEVGCGYGEAADLLATQEPGCTITAIDRSEKMAAAAARRNAEHISEGRITVHNCDLTDNPFAPDSFDKAIVYNINVFWMDPSAELAEIRRLLRRDGAFFLFHRPPPGGDPLEYAVEFEKNLKEADFAVANVLINRNAAVNAVCVVARP